MIKANGLTRLYGAHLAVNDVSFEIGPREIVGLLGHNGAGKTTIMKMITGFLEPSSGSATVNGLNVINDRLAIQQQLGYLPENCPLYPELSVLEYLAYAASLRGIPEAKKAERMAFAIEKTKLSVMARKRVSELSRGYKQRLGVAQAILNEPRLLILDEPTNGLDPSQILEMRALIKELSETATIVISTHIMQEVQAVCDRVIIINGGKVAMDEDLTSLQAVGRVSVSLDRKLESFGIDLPSAGFNKILNSRKDGEHHTYTLEPNESSALEAVPALAKVLVEKGAKIYAIQPVIRDLETIFGEITASANGKGGASK